MSEKLVNNNPEQLIETHKAAVEEITRSIYLDWAGPTRTKLNIEDYTGEIQGVKYRSRHPFKGGKQQPVVIVTLTFPEGEEFDVVLKRDEDGTFQKQKSAQVLREIFPKIFFETEQVAAIEFIDGLEYEPFQEWIKDPDVFQRFLEEAFEAYDKVSNSEFEFQDIDFTGGHNFIYDKKLNKFRAFDIHSIHASHRSYEEKLIDFVESQLRTKTITSESVRLYMYFLQKFTVMYPGRKLQFSGKGKVTLKPGDSGYEEQWKAVQKNCGWFLANEVPITSEKEGNFVINQAILAAAINGDEAAFRAAYEANNEHVYSLAA